MTHAPISNPRILVTRDMPGPWREDFASINADIVPTPGDGMQTLARADFLRLIAGCHAVVSMLNDAWDDEAFRAAGPQLRIVANYAVGFNNIDVAAARAHGVHVTNTPDVLTDATADLAWALLLAAARNVGSGERDLRAGKFIGWGPTDYLGVELRGATLGIIGAGRIGTATALRARGWDMPILYTHHKPKPDFEAATGGRRVDLDTLLADSDFISIHTPLTPETRHMIGAPQLARMKPTAVLINTARGPVVDEAALVEALRTGKIFAAGLDVYEHEPSLAPGLVDQQNAVLLPHIGSATHRARTNMARIVTQNIAAALAGETPPQLVPPLRD